MSQSQQNPLKSNEKSYFFDKNDDSDNKNNDIEPFIMFDYSIRSPQTKDSYFRRLRTFFEYSNIEGDTFRDKCNTFSKKGQEISNWALKLIVEFLQMQKLRVERKEITSGTLRNYQKTIKSFCEATDVLIQWEKVTRGCLPRGKRFSDDREPTIEEMRKIIEYPDRVIKPIVYVMASSGLRVGARDYLKWGHITPIANKEIVKPLLLPRLGFMLMKMLNILHSFHQRLTMH